MATPLFAIHDNPAAARAKVTKVMTFVKSKWAESSAVIHRSMNSLTNILHPNEIPRLLAALLLAPLAGEVARRKR